MIDGRVMITFAGSKAFNITRLNGAQWGYSVVLGALSLPVVVIIPLIPDHFAAKLIPRLWKKKLVPDLVETEEARTVRNHARNHDQRIFRSSNR